MFWLVVVFGFAFYMKSFNADMANGIGTWLGATNVANQDTLASGEDTTSDVMSGINALQTLLTDMQKTLNNLAGETTPTVTPTPVVETTPTVEATAE